MLPQENKIKILKDNGKIMAIIINPSEVDGERVFVTPEDFPLQVGVHLRKKGALIPPHIHLPFEKLENLEVQEIFYVLSGKITVTLYRSLSEVFDSVVLNPGEMIIMNCGHKIVFDENSRFFEIKQGPYRGVSEEKIILK